MTDTLVDEVPIAEAAEILVSKRDKFFWDSDDEEAPSDEWLYESFLGSLQRARNAGLTLTRVWDRTERQEPLIERWTTEQYRHAFAIGGYPDFSTVDGLRFYDKVQVYEALFVRIATHILHLSGVYLNGSVR